VTRSTTPNFFAAVAVSLGHMYSVFLRLKGGKGVATAVGVLLATDLYIASGAMATWIIIAFFFRISSLAALVAAAFVPFFSFFLYGIAFLYGTTGTTNIDEMSTRIAAQSMSGNPMILLGIGLLIVGFAFKIAAVPFHMWSPDAYEGAPAVVTGFMSTGVGDDAPRRKPVIW